MHERDSFGLNYSQTVGESKTKEEQVDPENDENQQLSPNKQTMLETFKENIMKPLDTEQVISSLTSVENDYPSLPNPSKKDIPTQEEENEMKFSLPSTKEIKKINSKTEETSFQNVKSKSKIPRTESIKLALTRKITDAVEFLAQGVQLEKYCFGVNKVEDVFINFSEDIETMAVYVITKGRTDILSMKECTNITVGMKTSRFQFYFENKLIQDEERCFSINFPSRSYDFVTKNKNQRDKIINSINFLRDCFQNPEE